MHQLPAILTLLLAALVLPSRAVDSQTGCNLTVKSLPPLAEVRLDGKFQGRAPVTVVGLTPGEHEVNVKLSGYAGYRTVVVLDSGRSATVEITLSNAMYEQWREQYYKTIVSNVLMPGKGQVDNGKQRGWAYFLGYVATTGYSYYCSNRYHYNNERYNSHLALYQAETDPAATLTHYQNLSGALDKMHYYQDQFQIGITALGVVWAVSVIDAFLFTVPRPVINDANPVRISAQPLPGGGMVGMAITLP